MVLLRLRLSSQKLLSKTKNRSNTPYRGVVSIVRADVAEQEEGDERQPRHGDAQRDKRAHLRGS